MLSIFFLLLESRSFSSNEFLGSTCRIFSFRRSFCRYSASFFSFLLLYSFFDECTVYPDFISKAATFSALWLPPPPRREFSSVRQVFL